MNTKKGDIDMQNELPKIASFPTNTIHDEALLQHFKDGIGRKAFILTPSFPFVFIGKIIDIIDDLAVIDVETTTIAQLENRIWNVHIDQIEAFFIERDDGPRIPKLKD
jgi:hypothetical protein